MQSKETPLDQTFLVVPVRRVSGRWKFATTPAEIDKDIEEGRVFRSLEEANSEATRRRKLRDKANDLLLSRMEKARLHEALNDDKASSPKRRRPVALRLDRTEFQIVALAHLYRILGRNASRSRR